jgi:Fic family protein
MKFDLADNLQKKLLEEDQQKLFMYFDIMARITMVNRVIVELPSFPKSTDTIIRSQMVSAIGATLAIEGRNLTQEEIEDAFKKAKNEQALRQGEQEAENARKVYDEFILSSLVPQNTTEFEYSETIIKEIHKRMTSGLNYPGNEPGQYRKLTSEIMFGHPPLPSFCRNEGEIQKAMNGLVNWLNHKDNKPITSNPIVSNPIVKAIMAHYYITEIHPFTDGNGRTARALEALVLFVNGINRYCFWSLANFWSVHRTEYLAYLREVRETCEPWNLLICGMKGYLEEITRIKEMVYKKVKQLMFRDYTKWLVSSTHGQKKRLNDRIIPLLEWMQYHAPISINKFLSSPELAMFYGGRTIHTRKRDLKKMLDAKLIRSFKENEKEYIEPNYALLESLRYVV